ncbi:MAG TPA: hypothetical protein VFH12_10750 [Pseudoxanthomonas sp.]|nr:hypothetical protein [Pseudoxanthomonas sp.]
MKSYSPEPLTPEERELAKLTAHLGPQGEPSSALDARILAAAHAALERKQPPRRKPRWPVAMGLAASVVFAVGTAWQLRPLQQAPMPASAEAPADEFAEQRAVVATIPSSPALPQADMAADTASAEAAPAPAEQAPPAPIKALAPPPAEFRAPPPRQQIARAKTRASNAERRAQSVGNAATASVPPPPPAPPAPAAMSVSEADAPVAFAPEPHERESHREGYSARAAATDSFAASAGTVAPVAPKPQAEALAEAKAARAAASMRQKESATLDRVEVTGSRMKRTDLQVPVSDDAQLPVNEWLERVRTRYGLGDAGAAKQSLLLFVKDHPSEPVPGDLEPLLEE